MYYAHINTGRPGGKSKFTSKYIDSPVEPLYPFGYGLSYTKYEYKELKAFEKVALKVGEKKKVRFTIPKKELGYYNWNMEYVTDNGEYVFYIGGNSKDCLEISIKD